MSETINLNEWDLLAEKHAEFLKDRRPGCHLVLNDTIVDLSDHLYSADLTGAFFNNVTFRNGSFSSIKLDDALLRDVRFENFDIWDISFVKAKIARMQFGEKSNITFCTFEDCDMYGTNFESLELNNVNFVNQQLKNVSFRHSILENCTFTGCDLDGADFTGTVFHETEFIDCKNVGADQFSKSLNARHKNYRTEHKEGLRPVDKSEPYDGSEETKPLI